MAEPRVGIGFDAHPPDPERPLMLAGVRFEGESGLAGHSDADVACHAVADAVLGAAALGDLGEHFPESDPRTAGMEGRVLLGKVVEMVRDAGLVPSSCDLTIVAARPRIAHARAEMRENLATALGLGPDRVSVKATRPEGLGLVGDGIGCLAVAMLAERES